VSEAAERFCYLHVGTHKTGTTAVQTALRQSAPELASAGILYPRSGSFGAGQHNLIFELMRDERFDRALGTWSDLESEVRDAAAVRLCLSSEAFGYLHERSDDLDYINRHVRALGFTPIIVLYVRPQAEYVESLYAEMAKHGYTGSFRAFFDEILSTKSFRPKLYGCTETYTFSYQNIAADFAGVFGRDHVFVRRYPRRLGAVVDDFIELLSDGFPVRRIPSPVGAQPLNARETFPAVIERYLEIESDAAGASNGLGRLRERLRAHAREVAEIRFAPLEIRQLAALAWRFAPDNAKLAREWTTPLAVVSAGQLRRAAGSAIGLRPRAALARKLFADLEQVRRARRPTRAAIP
jgi:hypothetical protein